MRSHVLMVLAVGLLATAAVAAPITLLNADIETNVTGKFGGIASWGPRGGWADHAGFVKPGNESLGANFGFYSAGTTETVGQLTGEIIQANMVYSFKSWAQGGGDNVGVIPYQIGYAAVDGNLGSFVALATMTHAVGQEWTETAGVTYATGAAGPEIGKQLIVRLGDGSVGGASDIWFDNFSASVVPEPAAVLLFVLGGLALIRRK